MSSIADNSLQLGIDIAVIVAMFQYGGQQCLEGGSPCARQRLRRGTARGGAVSGGRPRALPIWGGGLSGRAGAFQVSDAAARAVRASASVPRVTLDYRDTMRAMVLEGPGPKRLTSADREIPIALPGEIRVRVRACGVCRTDLHLVDGDLRDGQFPIIPGHEIVGVVDQLGDGVTEFAVGDRVGIPWLGYSCGACGFCTSGRENLCPDARFTGYHIDGGYADFTVADARYTFKIPDGYADADAAPL